MASLRDIFRSDAFVPTAAVFPQIGTDQLAGELRLRVQGAERGARNQPATDDDGFDIVEQRIIERVGELRRKGIDNYGINRNVYDARLARAADARKAVEAAAGKAKADFLAAVKVWKANMATPRSRVGEVFRGKQAFQRRHRLDRPADEPIGLMQVVFFAIALLLVETAVNAGLFAERNALGLAGGGLAAFLISVVNVSSASLAAWFGRNINHRNWLRKGLGLIAVITGIGWVLAFNLGVAHFRDAVETMAWEEATTAAWDSLFAAPLVLESVMSALLIVLGLLVSIAAALKTYHSFDPYPGYDKVERGIRRAREAYARDLRAAIETLDGARDEATEELEDANSVMRTGINEAVDALYGARSLRSGLDRFLDHCDHAVNLLLETYRDANRTARPRWDDDQQSPRVPAPPHFAQRFSFPPHDEPMPTEDRRTEAVREREEVDALVSRSIAEIFEAYKESIRGYDDIEALERLDGPHPAPVRAEPAARADTASEGAPQPGPAERPLLETVATLPRRGGERG